MANLLPLSRRQFFGGAACVGLGPALLSTGPGRERQDARGLASGERITRVKFARLTAPRWKMVGKNSRLGLHGKDASDSFMLIETDAGVTGIGQTWTRDESAGRALLGKDPLSFYQPGWGIPESPLGFYEWPLWDLVAKLVRQPLWRLFGGYGKRRVPVYDGSIYFTDIEESALWPEALGTGISRVLKEVDHSLERGHRAFKIKVGRGNKWMQPLETGLKRDIEVVRAIRAHVGPDVKLMCDANNGYDYETTLRFTESVDADLHFVEEMFDENIEKDLALKSWLREHGMKTLVADGETSSQIDHFVPFIEARAFDVFQGDARAFGFTRLLQVARMTAQTGMLMSPHNWGSCLGLPMQAQLGRGIPNFGIAEEDPGVLPFFDLSGYVIEEGTVSVPDEPGSGLHFDEAAFLKEHRYEWAVEAEK